MKTLLSILLFITLAAVTHQADGEVVGTVELTLDGEPQTWYVLSPDTDMLPNALWVAMGPDRGAVSITAYQDPEIDFVADEATRSPLPAGDAAALVISIGFPLGAQQQTYTLPTSPGEGPAVVMILRNWSNPLDGYTLDDGPGEIRLTAIRVSQDGPSRFAGTFHGTMRKGSGETRQVANGRFEIQRAPFFKR